MPILRKKSSKKVLPKSMSNRGDTYVGDVTIDDFANSAHGRARIKKAAANVSSEVKQEAKIEDEHLWSEEDETYEIDPLEDDNSKMEKKGKTANQRRRRKIKTPEICEEEQGIDYPLDVWFLLSEYISPEAVGKFACLCKNSYHVTRTGKFWFHLYKSYYRFVPGLPERLQPQCMVRTHGLRACVIRTLHYSYFALKRELDDVSYLRQDEPHSLVKRRCCLMWHKEGKVRWYFFFKLKEVPKSSKSLLKQKSKSNNKKTDFLEMLEDVAVNPEYGCKVLRNHVYDNLSSLVFLLSNREIGERNETSNSTNIKLAAEGLTFLRYRSMYLWHEYYRQFLDRYQNWNESEWTFCTLIELRDSYLRNNVTCLKYSMLPPVIGLILQTVTVTLMPGFKDHRLQLGFGTSDVPYTLTNQVILNDVISYQVLDWWHPSYPHQDAVTAIELPQNDSWD